MQCHPKWEKNELLALCFITDRTHSEHRTLRAVCSQWADKLQSYKSYWKLRRVRMWDTDMWEVSCTQSVPYRGSRDRIPSVWSIISSRAPQLNSTAQCSQVAVTWKVLLLKGDLHHQSAGTAIFLFYSLSLITNALKGIYHRESYSSFLCVMVVLRSSPTIGVMYSMYAETGWRNSLISHPYWRSSSSSRFLVSL